MTDISGADPAADFAALMGKAADAADSGASPAAPYGYTTDPDGTTRPKKAAGRPRKPPSIDELKAEKEAQAEDINARAGIDGEKPADRAPETPRRSRRRGKAEAPKEEKPVPQFREGVIAKGMNRLYRRAGKMVRVMDRDIGQAIIDATKKDDDEDVTVGEAWEEVARTNPRIRRFLMRMIAGGAWGQLFMAHAPILLAVLMKDAIRKHIPFHKLMEAFLDGGEDGEAPADGTPFEGLQPGDMDEMMGFAQQMAAQFMSGRGMSMPRTPVAPEAAPEAA